MRFPRRLPRPSDLDRLFRGRRLVRRLLPSLPPNAAGLRRIRLLSAPPLGNPYRAVLRKDGYQLLLCIERVNLRDDSLFTTYRYRTGVMLDLFARTSPAVEELVIDLSDSSGSGNGIVSFSSAFPGAILGPDPDFYESRGYQGIRAKVAAASGSWSGRDSTLVWRGSTTGKGLITTEEMNAGDSRLIQRTRLCLLARTLSGVDVKFSQLVQSADPSRDLARLQAAGIMGEPRESLSWLRRKFALDVDGNCNAWSNLFTRMLLGCCVLKVASQGGYRQWYYDELEPFQHFVPVAADLSDLAERLEWCRTHDAECARIGGAAASVAHRMSFEIELSKGVGRIESSRRATLAEVVTAAP